MRRNDKGVPYKFSLKYSEEVFYLEKGPFEGERTGIWTLELMNAFSTSPLDECWYCSSRNAPRVLYACPRCGGFNSVYIPQFRLDDGTEESLFCRQCNRHLWVVFKGFDPREWQALVSRKKRKPT